MHLRRSPPGNGIRVTCCALASQLKWQVARWKWRERNSIICFLDKPEAIFLSTVRSVEREANDDEFTEDGCIDRLLNPTCHSSVTTVRFITSDVDLEAFDSGTCQGES